MLALICPVCVVLWLYCTALYWAVLSCAWLYWAVLCCTSLPCWMWFVHTWRIMCTTLPASQTSSCAYVTLSSHPPCRHASLSFYCPFGCLVW
jgi:hypothetical protein